MKKKTAYKVRVQWVDKDSMEVEVLFEVEANDVSHALTESYGKAIRGK